MIPTNLYRTRHEFYNTPMQLPKSDQFIIGLDAGYSGMKVWYEKGYFCFPSFVKELTEASNTLSAKVAELKAVTEKADAAAEEDMQKAAESFHKDVLTLMDEMKDVANAAEEKIPDEELPYPTYDQMLFYV